MSNKKGDTQDGISNDLGLGIGDFDGCVAAGFSDSDFGDLNLDSFGGSGVQSADLGRSYFDEVASGLDLELTDAESAIVRLAEGKIAGSRGRAAATKSEKIYVTHEDFDEGAERDAFLLIFGYAEHLFAGVEKMEFDLVDLKKFKALCFFFCRSTDDLNFEDAVGCIDSHIRLDVLRLRFMLEFWLRGWKMPKLPWNADGLPSRIELMAAQHEAMIGVSLAREAWYEPGIEASELLERIVNDRSKDITDSAKLTEINNQVKLAFKELVIAYVLSISNGRVYTTGKNPILELEDMQNDPTLRVRSQLANIYWSRRF